MTTRSERPWSRSLRRSWLLRQGTLWLALAVFGSALVLVNRPRQVLSVLCSSVEELCEQWTQEFTAQTGTRIRMVRMSSGEALARLSRSEGEFDVWHGGSSEQFEVARGRGLLNAHTSDAVRAVPARWRAADDSWVGVYRGVLGLCSNTRVLGQLGVSIPRTWDDLTDPRLAGRISLPDPSTSGTGFAMLWTRRVQLGSNQSAIDWFTRLHPNVLQYTSSGMTPSGVAGRGEAAVAVTFTQHCLRAHDRGMDHLVVSLPDGPLGMEVGAVARLRSSREPHLAARYIDHAVSRRSQQADALGSAPQLPTLTDVVIDPRLATPSSHRVLGPDAQAVRERSGLLEEFGRRVRP